MVMFNLLPWRKYQRINANKNFLKVNLSVLILMLIIVISLHLFLLNQIGQLKKHVKVLDSTLKKFTVLQTAKKAQPVVINSEMNMRKAKDDQQIKKIILALNTPQVFNACFTKILCKKNMVYFEGLISSMEDLMPFFAHLQAYNLFSEFYIKQLNQEQDLIKFNVVGKEEENAYDL